MLKSTKRPKDIDEYISGYPEEIQKVMKQLRTTIKKAASAAEETISYGIPAFKLNGMLVWFAAHSKHIGFYPTPSGITHFAALLKPYRSAKGSVQFPLDKPVPYAIIAKIVSFRVEENTR